MKGQKMKRFWKIANVRGMQKSGRWLKQGMIYLLVGMLFFSCSKDEEDLLPSQDWKLEITKNMRESHVALVCLSPRATSKAGYLQKETK